jgi:hypothetical protein
MQTYNYDRELIKDFIKWVSDTHKCALVAFPDEFSSDRFVSYRFVNTVDLINEWDEGRKK